MDEYDDIDGEIQMRALSKLYKEILEEMQLDQTERLQYKYVFVINSIDYNRQNQDNQEKLAVLMVCPVGTMIHNVGRRVVKHFLEYIRINDVPYRISS